MRWTAAPSLPLGEVPRRAQDVPQRENLTWRSFWDGGNTKGPISTQWKVKGWPTIFILDHKGVIRHRDARGEVMDRAVDTLLKEVESK
ncbi:MAG: hypothetical protein FJ403_13555 [Verrucomicrobia bacterium]|nr:hypothetical protein [Verrucomicrobiota bacterium]